MITLTAHLQKYGMKCCPINNSIKMIGKKFALHILRNMILLKQKRFSQFLGSIEGISTKTLSIRLHEMEKEGLITREVNSTKPVQIEYSLTKKGEMFEPVLKLLGEFSVMYEPAVIFKDGKPRGPEGVFGRNVRLSSLYEY
jgi:DNA-binding HxlR family transcriptional regulator